MRDSKPWPWKRSRWWLWIVVPVATILGLLVTVLGAYMFYFGFLTDPPRSVIVGQWVSTVGQYGEMQFYEDGTFDWTITPPDGEPTTIEGTWDYHGGMVDVFPAAVDHEPLTGLWLQHNFFSRNWWIFDSATFGEGFDYRKVEGAD